MSIQTRLLTRLDSYYSNDNALDLSLFTRLNPRRYPYLLASSASRKNNTQYDILPACPQYLLVLNADKSLTCRNLAGHDIENVQQTIDASTGFFDALERLYQLQQTSAQEPIQKSTMASALLPFTGGWFVYLAYEMAEEIEPCLSLPPLSAGQPLALAARCPSGVILNKQNNQLLAFSEEKYEYLLDLLEADYRQIIDNQEAYASPTADTLAVSSLSEADPEPYLEQINRIQQYIVDGDIFQANLSRQWQVSLKHPVDDSTLFKALSATNPSAFAALARLDNMTVISSSPERLVSLRNGIVETRPIAGTRARDDDHQSDAALARELMQHPKEKAEHIMLIDLERNDLGRVCRPGSIDVNELMVLESWQHVHHIVSNIRGELKQDKSPVDVLRAVFPGGTITGCPKVRCMEILAEMEQQARGAYTGSLGYINIDGSMDFNILIRTMVHYHDTNGIIFRAGGGIVSDSIAENELEETRAKAKGLLKIFS